MMPSQSEVHTRISLNLSRSLLDRISGLAKGGGLLVLVTGPSGAGKTSFAGDIATNLSGWFSYQVGALPWEKDQPFGILRHLMNIANPERAAAGGSGSGDSSAPAMDDSPVDALAAEGSKTTPKPPLTAPSVADPTPADPTAEFMAMVDAPDSATIIVIDDAQWADPESLRVLCSAARRMTTGRLVVLVACSDDIDGSESSIDLRMIASLVDVNISLPPLSLREIRAMGLSVLGITLNAVTASTLRDMTGGRPQFIREVFAAQSLDQWRSGDSPLPIPSSWHRSLEQRLGEDAEDVKSVLAALSIFRDGCRIELLRYLVGAAHAQLIDRAAVLGVLKVYPGVSVQSVDFVYPMDRAVTRAITPPSVAAALNAKAARYFQRHDDPDSALIHSALGSLSNTGETASILAAHATKLGDAGAWRKSSEFYNLASTLSPEKQQAQQFSMDSIEALISASDIAAARVMSSGIDPTHRSAKLDSMLGYVALHEGRRSESLVLIDRAATDFEALADSDPSMAASIAARKTLLGLVEWRPHDVVEWAQKTSDVALENDGAAIEAQAIGLIGQSATSGVIPENVPFAGETPIQAQRRHMAMGWLAVVYDDPVEARDQLRYNTGVEGSERISLWQDGWLARANFLLGEWSAADRAVERGLARVERFGIRVLEPLLLWSGAQIATYRGDFQLARHYINRLTISQDSFVIQRIPSAMCRLLVSSLSNDIKGAVRAGDTLLEIQKQSGVDQPGFWPWEDVFIQALLRDGQIRRAEELLTSTEESANASGILSLQAKLAVPRGTLHFQRGENAKGVKVMEEALEKISTLPMPAYQSRILFEYGQVLRRLGQRRQADEMFTRASDVFASLGAEEFVERANRERRAVGLGPRVHGVGDLTPQELEIASLVAAGASNREVASELFLSTKTVEYHLTRVYRKLGIRSRNELPLALQNLG